MTKLLPLSVNSDGNVWISVGFRYVLQDYTFPKTIKNSTQQISGIAFFDKNNNGKFDRGEIVLPNQPIKLSPNITTYTNSEGKFSFDVKSGGKYTIEHKPYQNWFSTTSSSYSITTDSTSIDTLRFGINTTKNATNLQTTLTTLRTRCGFTVPTFLNYSNLGTTIENTIISLRLDTNINVVSTIPKADSTVDHTLYWHQNNFGILQSKKIRLNLQMPGVDFIGDTLTSYATISTKEEYSYTDTLESILTCAYDPNDKLVEPLGILDEHYTLMNQELDYTIRFQNTGNDTAFNVVLN